MEQQTLAPSGVDRIRVEDAFPAPTPDPALRRFAVRIAHLREGGESNAHFLIAEMPQHEALAANGDVIAHVRAHVELLGNGLPDDGHRLERLRALEPLAISAPAGSRFSRT